MQFTSKGYAKEVDHAMKTFDGTERKFTIDRFEGQD